MTRRTGLQECDLRDPGPFPAAVSFPLPSRTLPMRLRSGIPLLLALVACGSPGSTADREEAVSEAGTEIPEGERYGGTAVWAGSADLNNLNPLTSFELDDLQVDMFVLFAPLLRDTARGVEPRPWLAARWDTVRVAPDTLQLTFHLREDVEWHDGVPTTAEDVRFTFDRMIDQGTGFADIEEVSRYRPRAEVLDSFSIRFWLTPHDDLLEPWAWRAIAPEHILGDVPPARLRTHPFSTTAPVGNGPFRFLRRGNREWIFEANPDFPRELGGRPYLDRLVFRVVPDEQTLVMSLITGVVDAARVHAPATADALRGRGIRVLTAPMPEWTHIAWNTRLPIFSDARVRRALSMAIDRREIVDGILRGYAEVGRSTVTPLHWSYDADDPAVNLEYDPEGARRLLRRAGWMDQDGDGILENAEGRELRFSLLRSYNSRRQEDVAAVIQEHLGRVGVAVEILALEQATKNARLIGQMNATGERERDFEAALWTWYDNPAKDDVGKLHSRSKDLGFGVAGFSNARADELMDSLRYMMDREAALPLWKEYQQLIVRESPVTVLYYPHMMFAVGPRLHGVRVDAVGELASVRKWWVGPRR